MGRILVIAALSAAAAAFAEGPSVASMQGGRLEISEPSISFFMRIVYPKWLGQAVGRGEFTSEGGGLRRFDFSDAKDNPAAAKATGLLHVSGDGCGGVVVHYRVTLPEAIDAQQIGLQANVPTDSIAGGSFVVDGKPHPVPRVMPGGGNVFHGRARSAEFRDAAGKTLLRIDFPLPSPISLMGRSSETSGGYTLRIPLGEAAKYPAGTVLERAFKISGPRPFAVNAGAAETSAPASVRRTAMRPPDPEPTPVS